MKAVTLILCILLLGAAKPDKSKFPNSPAAAAARKKHEAAVAKAKAAYEKAVAAADKAYLKELARALDAAMDKKNLDEAKRIEAEQHRVAARGAPGRTFSIDSREGWQDTGRVRKGQKLRITAAGRICYDTLKKKFAGPDGNGGWGVLEARVGEGPPIRVGAAATVTAEEDGVLQFAIADDVARSDNEGSFKVTVEPDQAEAVPDLIDNEDLVPEPDAPDR